mgnify:CR=1 FL=1
MLCVVVFHLISKWASSNKSSKSKIYILSFNDGFKQWIRRKVPPKTTGNGKFDEGRRWKLIFQSGYGFVSKTYYWLALNIMCLAFLSFKKFKIKEMQYGVVASNSWTIVMHHVTTLQQQQQYWNNNDNDNHNNNNNNNNSNINININIIIIFLNESNKPGKRNYRVSRAENPW